MKTYAFDLDGTLTIETEGHDYEKRTPRLDRIRQVNFLFDQGETVILYTSRFPEDLIITTDWLDKYNVKYNKLVFGKEKYDVFIDDKSHHPDTFFVNRNYPFHRSCWRYTHGHVDENESHPCFFCGESIKLTTPECPVCGIIPCPSCGDCLCTVPDVIYFTAVAIHSKYCCHLDKYNKVILISNKLDKATAQRYKIALDNCYKLEFEK